MTGIRNGAKIPIVHGEGQDVVPVDPVLRGLLLVVAVPAGKQQGLLAPILLGIQHIVAIQEFKIDDVQGRR